MSIIYKKNFAPLVKEALTKMRAAVLWQDIELKEITQADRDEIAMHLRGIRDRSEKLLEKLSVKEEA